MTETRPRDPASPVWMQGGPVPQMSAQADGPTTRPKRPPLARRWRDLGSRSGWTVLQALVGILTGPEVADLIESTLAIKAPWLVAITVPAVAGAVSALKSFVATRIGNPDTVTFDPAPPDPPAAVPVTLNSTIQLPATLPEDLAREVVRLLGEDDPSPTQPGEFPAWADIDP